MIYNQDHPVLEEKERVKVWPVNVKNDVPDITEEDLFFAKERYKLHQTTPDEGVSTEILKKYFLKKYDF